MCSKSKCIPYFRNNKFLLEPRSHQCRERILHPWEEGLFCLQQNNCNPHKHPRIKIHTGGNTVPADVAHRKWKDWNTLKSNKVCASESSHRQEENVHVALELMKAAGLEGARHTNISQPSTTVMFEPLYSTWVFIWIYMGKQLKP